MTNNYKQDGDKPPVLDAVHIPFRRAILAVARLMEDMKERHKLGGAKDPFQEWRQLPDARRRLSNAAARHGMNPWSVNAKDGSHLHATHALWGWLAAVELWEEEQEKLDAESPCCGAPDARHVDDVNAELARVREASLALYKAGRWHLYAKDQVSMPDQAAMWADLRDALGLPTGTATVAGMGAIPPPPANVSSGFREDRPAPRAVRRVCVCGHGVHMHFKGQGCLGVRVITMSDQSRRKLACLCREGL